MRQGRCDLGPRAAPRVPGTHRQACQAKLTQCQHNSRCTHVRARADDHWELETLGSSRASTSEDDDYHNDDDGTSLAEKLLQSGMSLRQIGGAAAMGMLPFAALTPNVIEKPTVEPAGPSEPSSFTAKLQRDYKQFRDRIFFGETLPPIGAARISYARFLHLMNYRMIKRITILGDGKCALIECPIDQGGHDFETQRYNRDDLSQLFVRELTEWRMEMNRFYVDLPGDFWYNSQFSDLVKANIPHKTADGYQAVSWLTQDGQFHPEVRVKDPDQAFAWANKYAGQFVTVGLLILLRLGVGVLEYTAVKAGLLKTKLSEKEQLAEDMGKNIAKAFNVGKGRGKGTGVKFDDVAGIDHVKNDIKDILTLLLGDERYQRIGARVPRGILLEGPPGTGKTYLAKAMADEAGIPFYSANGAEFVQMFSGVAAARIRSLFKDARTNAPAIVFIDEIDAIGKARVSSGGMKDPGTAEREQGLLQLLVEMDGFAIDDKVLVIAATNRKDVLDAALLRPGRFDRSIFMGKPGPENRKKILQVHARGKQIPRDENDTFLGEVAQFAVGFSGAELANLLNEAAILQVRYAKPEVDLEVIQEALAKIKVGLPSPSLPLSKAKRHMATVLAGKAVAAAVTGGLPPIDAVSIKPYGSTQGRILYVPQDMGFNGDDWHRLSYKPVRGKSQPEIGSFAFCTNLLVPLYMGRAVEEALFGRASVTLSTSHEISTAGDLAHWLCLHSRVNPALFGSRYTWYLDDAGPDTVSQYMDPRPTEELCLRLQTLAFHRALLLVHQKRNVIETLTDELLGNTNETVSGQRLYELIDSTPDAEVSSEVLESLPFKELIPPEAHEDFMVEEKSVLKAANLVKGDIDPGLFLSRESLEREAELFRNQSAEWFAAQEARDAFATREDAPFPAKPDVRDKVVSV